MNQIIIGKGSNIQDGSVAHTDPGYGLTIGQNVTVGHMAMIHGCTIGDGFISWNWSYHLKWSKNW